MKARSTVVVLLVSAVLSLAGASQAAEITVSLTIPPQALDSGWDATYEDNGDIGIPVPVDAIDLTGNGYVVIEIIKTFRDFNTPISIKFEQRLADAVDVIRIAEEAVTNLTGVPWTDYHWKLIDVTGGVAFFDTTDPGNFSVSPFTNKNLQSDLLEADGGVVPAGGLFAPGYGSGPLYIVTDPAGQQMVNFTLVQYPTPEPATMSVLVLGAAALLIRRRRRH